MLPPLLEESRTGHANPVATPNSSNRLALSPLFFGEIRVRFLATMMVKDLNSNCLSLSPLSVRVTSVDKFARPPNNRWADRGRTPIIPAPAIVPAFTRVKANSVQ